MNAGRNIPAILLTAFLVVAIPSGLYFRRMPAAAINPIEAELARFSSKPVDISAPHSSAVFSGLASPVTQLHAKQNVDIGQKNTMTGSSLPAKVKPLIQAPHRSLGSLPIVSMISYDGSTRKAIVDNNVVTEGSVLDGSKIVKIEENRVLMQKNGKNIWLTIK
jgi:hypothetical protein